MNIKYRKQIRDIKRNAGKKRHRIFLIRRISALAILILILLITIFSIRGCSKSHKTSDAPVKTTVVAETPAPKGSYNTGGMVSKNDIDQSYFKNSCFVGNSVIESMEVYELVDKADYFAKIGLNVSAAATTATDNGVVPVIDELNSNKQYNRIFMMFGENELNWPSIDTFKSDYTSLIKKARKYQPNAKIYILAVTPIAKSIEKTNEEDVTKDAIVQFNKYLEQIAKTNNATYVDIYTALANKNGYLPEGAATDGIHFGEEYYTKCLVYIQNNYD